MRLTTSLALLFIILITHKITLAKVLPEDGASLHYRLIGFSFPLHANTTGYRLEVFDYTSDVNHSVLSKSILTKEGKSNKIIATIPSFGKKYVWRVKYLNKGKVIATSDAHYFSVKVNPFPDAAISRVVVIDSASEYKNLMLFFDNTRALHNMKGEILWYLPVIAGITDTSAGEVRDLKMTPVGTITFLNNKNIYEIDYNGHILWSGHNKTDTLNDITGTYHHQFTRLANGHYMTIKNKIVINKDSTQTAASEQQNEDGPADKQTGTQALCGTIVEYDNNKNIVWTWNSCDHIHVNHQSSHFNAFYFDEKDSMVYSSYRNLSRIVKAKYPSGEVLELYGEDFNRVGGIKGNGLFYYQHNCNINSDGDLVFFNNNFNSHLPLQERNKCIPTVVVLHEPVNSADSLKKIWEFKCDIDTFTNPVSTGGGSVRELDKGDYLVCTGIPGRNFIVSKDKKILWNVVTQQYKDAAWKPFAGYRISLVKEQDLEKLLFR